MIHPMIVLIYGLPFHLRAPGWGNAETTAAALDFAMRRMTGRPVDLNVIAVEAAAALNCLRGSFVLRQARPDDPVEGAIAEAFARPTRDKCSVTATSLARRLGLGMDLRTLHRVGAALRRQIGPPRRSNGKQLWEVPDIWS